MPPRREARLRHASRFLEQLRHVEDLFQRGGSDAEAAIKGFVEVWPQVQAGQEWVAQNAVGDEKAAWMCSEFAAFSGPTGKSLLDIRRHVSERAEWLRSGVAAARRLGDRGAEGVHLHHLGLAHIELHEHARGTECLKEARAIFRAMGERVCEGTACCALGTASSAMGEPRRALRYFRDALRVYRAAGS